MVLKHLDKSKKQAVVRLPFSMVTGQLCRFTFYVSKPGRRKKLKFC